MNSPVTRKDSPGWIFQVWASFLISFGTTLGGIYFAPIDLWIKGFFAMGVLFIVGSTFSLAKTMRDQFEESKITNRIASAKTEKILHDYEFGDSIRNTA